MSNLLTYTEEPGPRESTQVLLTELHQYCGPQGLSEASSVMPFTEPCQRASVPTDWEKHMPLFAPGFAFLSSFAAEDGNVQH